ncbi:MAG: hypothetical protein UX10_C0022G0008 [Candidatus Magasanikbacteria bacterium GW2011_GWA2_45_39]|uniref:Uncharacterized protein n=2 Tax=Candidatus Magasanikiibacteriota TaxID=1752731 RepID=A0A0G1N0M9_9BACT|nr:MAG: hypothetical protein UX10_C0022G0008 [Candidatus Magasanikbacteria bacterium GW2011_GWA2_45_39]KKU13917.1 MAG: hypothetical protein UX20_C0010G0009 [Candidatus Magasanikbacteria bacterium GW2011_GWC2_45_8]
MATTLKCFCSKPADIAKSENLKCYFYNVMSLGYSLRNKKLLYL